MIRDDDLQAQHPGKRRVQDDLALLDRLLSLVGARREALEAAGDATTHADDLLHKLNQGITLARQCLPMNELVCGERGTAAGRLLLERLITVLRYVRYGVPSFALPAAVAASTALLMRLPASQHIPFGF